MTAPARQEACQSRVRNAAPAGTRSVHRRPSSLRQPGAPSPLESVVGIDNSLLRSQVRPSLPSARTGGLRGSSEGFLITDRPPLPALAGICDAAAAGNRRSLAAAENYGSDRSVARSRDAGWPPARRRLAAFRELGRAAMVRACPPEPSPDRAQRSEHGAGATAGPQRPRARAARSERPTRGDVSFAPGASSCWRSRAQKSRSRRPSARSKTSTTT